METYENTYLQYGLNCPVKSISVRHYKAVQTADGIAKGKEIAENEVAYDAKFDERGRLVELNKFAEEEFSLGDDKYIYDAEGRLSEIVSYDGGELVRTLAYSYDGAFLKSVVNLAQGSEEFRREEYSNDGQNITAREELEEGQVLFYSEYTRPSADSTIITKYYEKGDTDVISYEIRNARSQIFEIKAAPACATGYVTYDDASHLPMSSSMCYVSTDGAVEGWDESDYGYTYIFDSHGNWIRRITWISAAGIPQLVTERTIEY